jgi:alpha-tubulin suppressor-like RCC1 family protein
MRASLLIGLSVVVASIACGRKQGPSAKTPGDGGAGVSSAGSDAGTGGAPVATSSSAAHLGLGGWRSCAALTDGTVRCWGVNPNGLSLAGETRDESATPTTIPALHDVVQLAVGQDHTCALVKGGAVWCWGVGDHGQLGGAVGAGSATPAAVAGIDHVAQIVAGDASDGEGGFTCARLDDGHVRCWGSSQTGAAGPIADAVPAPTEVAGVDHAIDLAAGEGHVCAVREDGHVVCWGRNDHGQCGVAKPTQGVTPTVVAGVTGAVGIAAGPTHTCARLGGGAVRCWGENDQYQLGDVGAQTATPVALAGARDVVELALGRGHTCVRTHDGAVQCVGGNDRGAFGYPHTCALTRERGIAGTSGVIMSYCASLTEVADVRGAVELAHGRDHACARMADGSVRCWGGAGHSELGNRAHGAARSEQPIAVDLAMPPPAAAAEAEVLQVEAAGSSTCALMADHGVRCWGDGTLGQLGVPAATLHVAGEPDYVTHRAHPEAVPGVKGATQLALGGYTGCALLDDGRVSCWGNNRDGELGDRKSTDPRAAAIVPGLDHVHAIAISPSSTQVHVCAVLADASVRCWGGNGHGELGVDHASADGAPVAVPGLTGVAQIAAGDGATCAVKTDGSVWCFGDNTHGLLGDGTHTSRAKPAAVPGVKDVAEVAIAYDHACARGIDGSVRCWGAPGPWAPGSDKAGVMTPTAIAGWTDAVAIRAGYSGMMIIRKDGSVQSRYFDSGFASPKTIDGLTAAQVSWSGYHACAVRRDHTVRCWGDNGNGQMGDAERGYGGEQQVPSPVRW